MYRYYNPVHSDYLIHWTGGKDIDQKYDPNWTNEHSSKTNKEVTEKYLKRLKGILKFGLWMTKDKDDEAIEIDSEKIKRPHVARTCFTELKLSSARSHASEYGRLGIGFKRFFLLNRLGAPMTYYQHKRRNWFFPPYFHDGKEYSPNHFFSCFLKNMTKKSSDTTFEYKYYDESEWRIIYSEEIEKKLSSLKQDKIINKFKKPSAMGEDFQEYIIENGSGQPKYLIPIRDEWFCMIIYPSLAAKVEAESDKEVRNLIENIKPKKPSNINYYQCKNPFPWEKYSKPIEIDLDACRNF